MMPIGRQLLMLLVAGLERLDAGAVASVQEGRPLRCSGHSVVVMSSHTNTSSTDATAIDHWRREVFGLAGSGGGQRSDIEEVVVIGIDLYGLGLAGSVGGSGGLIRLDRLGQVEEQELLRFGAVVWRRHVDAALSTTTTTTATTSQLKLN